MLKGRNPKKKYLYTPISQENEETPTQFWLKPIGLRLHAHIGDTSMDMVTESTPDGDDVNIHRVKGGTKRLTTLLGCICGWENFGDEDGNLIDWNDGSPAEIEDSIGWIKEATLDELFFKLTDSQDALDEIRKIFEAEQKQE